MDRQMQKMLLTKLVNRLKEEADKKQMICDRHDDNPDSAAYRRAEHECTEILREKTALVELMKDAGVI